MKKEKQIFEFETKSTQEDGVFYGYASVFDVVDNHGDIVKKGAFDIEKKDNISLLWQHKHDQPIGKILSIKETEDGLLLTAKIIVETSQGGDVYKLLKSGVVTGLSIGYVLKEYNFDKSTGARIITKVDLLEVSLVTFPANKYARVSEIKTGHTSVADSINRIRNMMN